METIHLDLLITGKVHGVWYRKGAVLEATRLGITGSAMNLPDGSVRIEAEGPMEELDRFIAWCRTGPPLARVDDVRISTGDVVGYAAFATRY